MKLSFRIAPVFYIILVFGVLLVPLSWLFAWILAAMWHELCHVLAIRFLGGSIYSFSIEGNGAKIETDINGGIKMILCSLAGPVGGLVLLCFCRLIPRVALCALFQSAYNLLPIYPLDGGRALTAAVSAFSGASKAGTVIRAVEVTVILVLAVLAVYACVFLKSGILPVLIVVSVFLQNKNIPCKERLLRVQYP